MVIVLTYTKSIFPFNFNKYHSHLKKKKMLFIMLSIIFLKEKILDCFHRMFN